MIWDLGQEPKDRETSSVSPVGVSDLFFLGIKHPTPTLEHTYPLHKVNCFWNCGEFQTITQNCIRNPLFKEKEKVQKSLLANAAPSPLFLSCLIHWARLQFSQVCIKLQNYCPEGCPEISQLQTVTVWQEVKKIPLGLSWELFDNQGALQLSVISGKLRGVITQCKEDGLSLEVCHQACSVLSCLQSEFCPYFETFLAFSAGYLWSFYVTFLFHDIELQTVARYFKNCALHS